MASSLINMPAPRLLQAWHLSLPTSVQVFQVGRCARDVYIAIEQLSACESMQAMRSWSCKKHYSDYVLCIIQNNILYCNIIYIYMYRVYILLPVTVDDYG